MRNKLYIVAGVVFGLVFTFFAVQDFSSASGDEVDCGGETMQAGDTCMTFGEDGGVRDADDQRDAYQSSGRRNLLWAGGSFAAAGHPFYPARGGPRAGARAGCGPGAGPAPPPPPPA